MSDQPVRIAFLGAGWISTVYADALAKLPGVEVVAICNHNIGRAKAMADKHLAGRPTCYDDFDAMLAAEAIDGLYVALPPGAYSGQAEKAAAKGIHLMLEKPIALTLDRAESIRAAVKAAGVHCQIGHHLRHTPAVMRLKAMIDDGTAGRPVLMTGHWFANARFPTWWRNPALGGGQLVEQSIHLYDLARHLFGEPAAAHGFRDNLTHARFDDYKVDDISAATVRFRNGALANLCATNTWTSEEMAVAFTVQCEKVLVKWRSQTEAEFIHHGGLKPDEVKAQNFTVRHETVTGGGGGGHYAELSRNFVAAIQGEEQTRSTVDDGVESLRLVLAVAASAGENMAWRNKLPS